MGTNSIAGAFSSVKATATKFSEMVVKTKQPSDYDQVRVSTPLLDEHSATMSDAASSAHLSAIQQNSTVSFNDLSQWLISGHTDADAEPTAEKAQAHEDSYPCRQEIYQKFTSHHLNTNLKTNNEVKLQNFSNKQLRNGLNQLGDKISSNESKTLAEFINSTGVETTGSDGLCVLKFLGVHVAADINPSDKYGGNIATQSAGKGDMETLRKLYDSGIDLNQSNPIGLSPATFAATDKSALGAFSELTQLGVDLNQSDSRGLTPATTATQFKNPEGLRELVNLGADLNQSDDLGHTPATIAAKKGDSKTLSVLHELGADLSQADDTGRTPAQIATDKNNSKVLKLLQQLGVLY